MLAWFNKTGFYEPDRNNFAPRFGFAWTPPALNRLVMRGGFGIYYNRIPNVLFSNTRGNPPNFARFSICCGSADTPYAAAAFCMRSVPAAIRLAILRTHR